MPTRGIVLILACALLGGCGSSAPISNGLATSALASPGERDPAKKTLASKVLAAIALERVTGRKTDPSRLVRLN